MDIETLNVKKHDYSYYGEGSKLKGVFELTGIVKISSQMFGEIIMRSENSFLTIEKGGNLQGDITCQNIEIFGEFNGNLHAQNKIIIQTSARVNGTIKSKSLTIYPGAVCNLEGHTSQENPEKIN